jgi:multiple sugar transport system ATP-binding protein
MSTVTLKNISKHFGSTRVIPSVDLDIGDGEFVVFVGPSGCGKSTLLRMIAGLEDTTSGRLSIAGQDVTHLPPAERGVAMVFQSYALYPHMNVFDNMAFGLRTARIGEVEIGQRVTSVARILQAEGIVRRTAPARGHRPCDRQESEGFPVRRAAVQPGRGIAREDAD